MLFDKNMIDLFDNYLSDYTCMWNLWIRKLRHTYVIISIKCVLLLTLFSSKV